LEDLQGLPTLICVLALRAFLDCALRAARLESPLVLLPRFVPVKKYCNVEKGKGKKKKCLDV
jgi:hypothetical protein